MVWILSRVASSCDAGGDADIWGSITFFSSFCSDAIDLDAKMYDDIEVS